MPDAALMKSLLFVGISLLLLSLAYGCVTKSNYKVLSFFFDGVPDPEKTVTAGEMEDRKKAQKNVGNPDASVHGPFAARLCVGCHNPGTNRLKKPVDELCSDCHKIQLDKKWIHGPVVSGGCRVCHNPHSSSYRYLLVADSKDFCFYCHTKDDVFRNPVHQGIDSGCTSCHDAHMSDSEYLLK
jgi:predicted CXXCH cytochrome family protein